MPKDWWILLLVPVAVLLVYLFDTALLAAERCADCNRHFWPRDCWFWALPKRWSAAAQRYWSSERTNLCLRCHVGREIGNDV